VFREDMRKRQKFCSGDVVAPPQFQTLESELKSGIITIIKNLGTYVCVFGERRNDIINC